MEGVQADGSAEVVLVEVHDRARRVVSRAQAIDESGPAPAGQGVEKRQSGPGQGNDVGMVGFPTS